MFTKVRIIETDEIMSIEEYCGWLALIEAVLHIKQKDEERGKYKIAPMKKYIDSRIPDLTQELLLKYESNDFDLIKSIELLV